MKKNKRAIVITTINPPSKAVIKFSKIPNYKLYIAGDTKGPTSWNLPSVDLLDVNKQNKLFPKFSNLVSFKHYARKNIAYLAAIRDEVAYIYETDDDNIPYDDIFPNFFEKKINISSIKSDQAFNIYSLFTKKNIWPRGLPLKCIKNQIFETHKIEIKPLIQQSLADNDPDVDAIYRLTNGTLLNFDKNKKYSLSQGTYCPFNSQNTFWDKTVFPLLYLPSTIESRVTDIWRGYIAQRILWELNSELIFLSPSVYQDRNIHDYLRDFKEELDLYLKVDDLIFLLQNLSLSGTVKEMMIQIYQQLVKHEFILKHELEILQVWLEYFN